MKKFYENNCLECEFFCYQKDNNEQIVVTYCDNVLNKSDVEGNTNENDCPLEDMKLDNLARLVTNYTTI